MNITLTNVPNILQLNAFDFITFTTSEGLSCLSFITNTASPTNVLQATTGTVINVTFLDPQQAKDGGIQIPFLSSPELANSGKINAQTLNCTFCGFAATGSALLGMTNINIEVGGLVSGQVYDTNINSYSSMIASVPCPPIYLRQNLPQEIQMYWSSLINQVGYPINDQSFLNNNNINFTLTYNTGGIKYILPQPAALGSVLI